MSNTYPIHSIDITYEAPDHMHWQECSSKSWWRLFTKDAYKANAYICTHDEGKDKILFWSRYDDILDMTSDNHDVLVIEDHKHKQRAMIAVTYKP